MYCNQKTNKVMKHPKFRVLAVHENGATFTYLRPTLQSCFKFVRDCLVNLYPVYGCVTYYIQEFNKSVNDYVSLITCDYYYSDLPF